MREVTFIKQNKDRWQTFENEEDFEARPDELSERFVQLTDDLSFSRTFFPDYPVTQYLNNLTTRFHQKIYRNKKEKKGYLLRFWKYELPLELRAAHKQLLYAFSIFALAVVIGAVSTAYDETFIRLILGDNYVNMTLENIEKGDPMGVYKSGAMFDSFLMITINNIRVSFLAFVMGVFFSVGTFYILFSNGVMLGAFQYFFFQKGVLLPSLLSIWIHGTLEISAIVIAGCAGLVMGNSLVFPKTYARLESFKKGVQKGFKIVLGIVPIFVMAGFLEGFVTRQPLHPIASVAIIGTSAFIIGYYFVYYPIKIAYYLK
jgi:uncharacterized membrane protein SpoIIM required for sporulation